MSDLEESIGTTIAAEFRRTALTRVVHVDGAWGGLTPSGHVLMALYSERSEMPESTLYDVGSDGSASQLDAPKTIGGITRDIEIEAIMSVLVAKSLVTWLENKIADAETIDELRAKSE